MLSAARSAGFISSCRDIIHPSPASASSFLHSPAVVSLFSQAAEAINRVGDECNELIAEDERLRAHLSSRRGRRWTASRVAAVLLDGREGELRQEEQRLRLSLSSG